MSLRMFSRAPYAPAARSICPRGAFHITIVLLRTDISRQNVCICEPAEVYTRARNFKNERRRTPELVWADAQSYLLFGDDFQQWRLSYSLALEFGFLFFLFFLFLLFKFFLLLFFLFPLLFFFFLLLFFLLSSASLFGPREEINAWG